MKLRDILARKGSDVVTIRPDRTLGHAVGLLVEHGIGSVVVEEEGKLVGILTERDILRQADRDSAGIPAFPIRDLMTRDVITGTPDDQVRDVMDVMTTNRVRHLPVLDEGRLVGMISIGDIVNALRRDSESENSYLKEYVRGMVR